MCRGWKPQQAKAAGGSETHQHEALPTSGRPSGIGGRTSGARRQGSASAAPKARPCRLRSVVPRRESATGGSGGKLAGVLPRKNDPATWYDQIFDKYDSSEDVPASPCVPGLCQARCENTTADAPTVCFEAGRFTLTQSSAWLRPDACKWMTGSSARNDPYSDKKNEFGRDRYREKDLPEAGGVGKPPFSP